jgi:DNA-binding MarR family transcriptional regulator
MGKQGSMNDDTNATPAKGRGPTPELPSLARLAQRIAGAEAAGEAAQQAEVTAEADLAPDGPTPEERAAALWDHLGRIYHLIRREAGRFQERSLARINLLAGLHRSGGLSADELAERTRLSPGTLQSLLARMKKEGLVARKTGRGSAGKVKLTAKGNKTAREMVARHHRDLAEILRALPDEDVKELERSLGSALEKLEGRFRSRRSARGS